MPSFDQRFAAFESSPPPELFGDPIWRLPAYRIALFLADVAQADAAELDRLGAPRHIAEQLLRSTDSIGANLAEGYSRFSGRERARYYEIALGSAREAREWYRRAIPWIGQGECRERAQLLTRSIKILVYAVPRERNGESEARMRKRRPSPGK